MHTQAHAGARRRTQAHAGTRRHTQGTTLYPTPLLRSQLLYRQGGRRRTPPGPHTRTHQHTHPPARRRRRRTCATAAAAQSQPQPQPQPHHIRSTAQSQNSHSTETPHLRHRRGVDVSERLGRVGDTVQHEREGEGEGAETGLVGHPALAQVGTLKWDTTMRPNQHEAGETTWHGAMVTAWGGSERSKVGRTDVEAICTSPSFRKNSRCIVSMYVSGLPLICVDGRWGGDDMVRRGKVGPSDTARRAIVIWCVYASDGWVHMTRRDGRGGGREREGGRIEERDREEKQRGERQMRETEGEKEGGERGGGETE